MYVILSGYLSWSRNAAVCAGVAATVRMFEGGYGPPSTFITGELMGHLYVVLLLHLMITYQHASLYETTLYTSLCQKIPLKLSLCIFQASLNIFNNGSIIKRFAIFCNKSVTVQ